MSRGPATRLSVALDRVGSQAAVSWPGFWVTFLLTGFGNLVTTPSMPIGARIGVIVAGQAVLWSVLIAMRVVFLCDPSRSRPLVVLVGFVLAAAMRAALVALWTGAVLGSEQVRLGIRIATAVSNLVPVLVICALVVSLFRERRDQAAQLASVREGLEQSLDATRSAIIERNDEAVVRVRAVIADGLAGLDTGDAGQSLDVLQHLVSDVVRPLSHELAQGAIGRAETAIGEPAEVDLSEVLATIAVGRPFRPLLTTLFLVFSVSITLIVLPLRAWVGVVLLGLVAGQLALANVVLERVLRGRSRMLGVVAVVVTALVIAFVCGAFMAVVSAGQPVQAALTATTVVFVAVLSLIIAFASAVLRGRERVIAELDASSRALRHAIARMRLVEWFQQRALSRALHGPVQTAVAAAAIRIDGAIRDGTIDAPAIESIRGDLIAGLEVLAHPTNGGGGVTLDDGIARMSATWEGIAEVSSSTSDDAARALAADDALRSCVLDLVTEAVSNAVRHGGATRAAIDVDLDGSAPDTLRLRVVSDARGPSAASSVTSTSPGLGTRLIEDCTLDWSRESGPDGQTLRARLPLA